jgi:3-oxoacyl-[acyl-carrier-protein] synthase-3
VLLGRQDGQDGQDGQAGQDDKADALHLLALATLAVPELEGMFRGGDDFAVAPLGHGRPIDIRRPKKAFLQSDGMATLRQLGPAKVREVIARSLDDAGVAPHDPKIRYIALPRLGGRTIQEMYIPAIAQVLKAEPLQLGDRTGHLGAGDFLANIADIIQLGLLEPGEIALVVGGGGGFTLSCAVLRAPGSPHTR